jgi:hypothetical protein
MQEVFYVKVKCLFTRSLVDAVLVSIGLMLSMVHSGLREENALALLFNFSTEYGIRKVQQNLEELEFIGLNQDIYLCCLC